MNCYQDGALHKAWKKRQQCSDAAAYTKPQRALTGILAAQRQRAMLMLAYAKPLVEQRHSMVRGPEGGEEEAMSAYGAGILSLRTKQH